MTIPSVFFSIMAFIIVSTTSFVVIHNKTKVKNIDSRLVDANRNILISEGKQSKKIQNLVNEINLSNQKTEHSNKKTVNQQREFNVKSDAKHANLDKRFNSYKNITTANFVGLNNRVTADNNRLKQDIEFNNKKINNNKRDIVLKTNELSSKIDETNSIYNNFKRNEYQIDMNRLNTEIAGNTAKYNELLNLISQNQVNLGTIEVDMGNLLDSKVSRTRNSLNNFFRVHDFTADYSDKNYKEFTDNFSDWHNNYYSFNKNKNFKNFEDMITNVDSNVDDLRTASENIVINSESIENIRRQLLTNLDKANYQSYMQNTYNFNPNNLTNIASNAEKIESLKSNIDQLQDTLKSIGINDPLSVEGPITLDDLNTNIQSNLSNIRKIDQKTDNLFNSNFQTFFDNSQKSDSNLSFLSKNINHNEIANKFDGTETLNIDTLMSKNIYTNDIYLENYYKGLSEIIGSNQPIVNAFNDTIERHIPTSDESTVDYLEKRKLDLDELNRQKLINLKSTRGLDNLQKSRLMDSSEFVKLKPGADLHVSDNMNRDGISYGGNIFVSSFDNIGELGYVYVNGQKTSQVEYDNLKSPTFSKFTNFEQEVVPNSLGEKLRHLDGKIDAVDQRFIDKENAGGVSKTQLYNAIHSGTTADKYNVESWARGGGNGLRIENLYTGMYQDKEYCFGVDGIYNANNLPENRPKCQTVNQRLENLENLDSQTGFTNTIGQSLSSLSGEIGDSSKNLTFRNPTVNVNTLQASTLQGNDATFTNVNSEYISFSNLENLKFKDSTTGRLKPVQEVVLMKNENPYVSDITKSANATTFTLRNKSDQPEIFTIPDKSASHLTSLSKQVFTNPNPEYTTYTFNRGTPGSTEIIRTPHKCIHSVALENNADTKKKTLKFNKINLKLDGTLGDPENEEIPIDISPDMNHIKEELGFGFGRDDNNTLRIGDGCLKLENDPTGRKLKLCDKYCANCTILWDHVQAPIPTLPS
jgi:hypothetical protein